MISRRLSGGGQPMVFYQPRQIRILALALFFFSGFGVSSAQSETYIELNLTVTQTNFQGRSNTWSSRCVFGQKKWLIESHFARNGIDYFYCDGTNVYWTSQITSVSTNPPPILKNILSSRPIEQTNLPKATDPIILSITPGIHPLSDTGANLPWLSYCSGSYIRNPNQLMPLIAAIVRHDPTSFAFEHQEEVFSDDLGLPKKLSLLRSEKLLKTSPFDVRLRRNTDEVRSARFSGDSGLKFIDGMLAAQYTVIASTNIAGRVIPTVFTYEQFDVTKDTLVTWLFATGIASNIHLTHEPQSIISPTQSYTAVDYRFRSQDKILDAIVYPITNGVVPSVSDPRLQSIFKDAEMTSVVDPITKAR